ncbi:MAG: squalene/phytoene synthase family protein, partial [Mariprofundus sp.]|nr:squalene/phytoene synthase family protein [Mariprofundus sp.]
IGRIYLPQEDRIRHKVADQAFKNGDFSPGMQQLLREYADKAEAAYRQALASLADEDRESLRPSIVMGAIYYAYLQQLRAVDFNVWQHPVHMLPLKKIWIAWRAWRYEKKAVKKKLPLKLEF